MDLSREIASVGYWYDASRLPAYTAGLIPFPTVHAVAADGAALCPFRPERPEMDYCWAATTPYWAYVDCRECLAIGDEQHRQKEREGHNRLQAQRMLDQILGR